jgi:hypothetical protein
MFHFTLCWVYVVIFRNLNPTLDGDCLYLVTYRLEMSTCSTVEGLAMSDLFYTCFGGNGVSTQTRIEVNYRAVTYWYETHVQVGTPFLP